MGKSWNRLLVSLRTWADVVEVPEGLAVTFENASGESRTVHVIMTPDDWGELADCIQREDAESLGAIIRSLPPERPFLICDRGVEMVPSASRVLPQDHLVFPGPGGEWVVLDADGNVKSRLNDFVDDV